ncbi:MAG: hypothetical protein M0Z60_11090, partial [Nitrospiraceae bacterium]|nr:hypothetical protein [Nitrospiraceae bacterium]
DSSIVALYRDGKKLRKMRSVIKASWEGYTCDVIRKAEPEHVICIGKGVAKVLEADLRRIMGDHYTVIPQPNAHLSAEEHMVNFRGYGEICIGN